MTDPSRDIAEVAGKLTKAQRESLLGCWQDEARHAPYHVFPNTPVARKAWRELLRSGMVTTESGGFDLVIRRGWALGMVVLTPLGLAVREHLKQQGSNHG